MPPKTKFSRDTIIDAAFHIAMREGIYSITIRKVAEHLGSSIAPIYVNFTDVAELIQVVVQRIFAFSDEYLLSQDTGQPFHDIGVATLRFAREYPLLFRDMVMRPNPYLQHEPSEMNSIIDRMKTDPELADFTDEELMPILLKMRIFTLGLSVMTANSLLPEGFNDIEVMDSTSADIIAAARMRQKGEQL
ncbi:MULTISPECIES: TetR/AcrR family transcriptional regulator [Paenibacillus]|uniref:TetR/AcrR family transcriptional regulator n=1 Tax=Paenibacillus alvei TaxID=44250 RepID=A0ABT4E6X0_PAEAL|nr:MULTISPECIES: TetR/AcrR family transcriptional regulator [Paenibacillus]MCY9529485.1 TetR/AcrR family transcriptional regulator [Paenibacillus alvei]SDF82571.1 regulatory protein, tetR family [Paenibacillus sp. cl6col]